MSQEVKDEVIERSASDPGKRSVLERLTGKRLVDGVGLHEDPIVIVPSVRAPRNPRLEQKNK